MPSMTEIAASSCALIMLFVAAHLVGRLFESMRLPRVIGEITGGLLLGPTLLSRVLAVPMSTLFSDSSVALLLPIVSQIGLVLLMFASGAHLRTFVQRHERKLVLILAAGGILIPFAAGVIAEHFLDLTRFQGPASHRLAFLLVFATAVAIASIPVISRIMIDLGIMDTPFARIVVCTAVIDDLVLYVVLAVALSLVQTAGQPEYGLPYMLGLHPGGGWAISYHVFTTVGLVAVVLVAGPTLLKLMRKRWLSPIDNDFISQAVFLTAVIVLSKFLNINLMFGALAAGMVAGRISVKDKTESPRILKKLSEIFIPIYFAIVGFKLDLVRHFDVSFFLGFLAFACVVKAASIYGSARMAGQSPSNALNFAAALNARGGPGIVLASVAYEAQIISDVFYSILVLTAVVTSLMAGAWLAAASHRCDLVTRRQFAFEERTA
jgi:Kef-type K+ transport system membrane component KefB